MIQINPKRLLGSWKEGWALDIHTVSSTFLGYDEFGHEQFDTVYSPLGEALNKLKYKSDKTVLDSIAETVAAFIITKGINQKISALVIVPPTNTKRPFQPNIELIKLIGQKLNLPFYVDYIVKVKDMSQLKNIFDPDKRRDILKDAYKPKDTSLKGKTVLLFDDLCRSGSTLETIANLLIGNVGVTGLYVITLTKTRVKR